MVFIKHTKAHIALSQPPQTIRVWGWVVNINAKMSEEDCGVWKM